MEAQELLSIIAGTGKFSLFGPGLRTYPGRDENNDKLHDACVELEKRGLVKSVSKIEDGVACWLWQVVTAKVRRGDE